VPAGATVDLFRGKMILLRWDPAGQLKIVFSEIDTTPGRGVIQGCTALDEFTSRALPAMQTQVDILAHDDVDSGAAPGTVIGKGSCVGCHAAEPANDQAPSQAVQAMDLRGISQDPALACAQARLWINFQNKAQSTLLLNPKGEGNPQHPMSPLPSNDPVIQGLEAWVEAEAER
jgi:hypothetical protein